MALVRTPARMNKDNTGGWGWCYRQDSRAPGWSMSLTGLLTLFPAVMLTLRSGIAVVGVKVAGAGEAISGLDEQGRCGSGRG